MFVVYCLLMLIKVCLSENSIVALILARGGSQGIPLKNLQLVGSVSLLQRTIHTARCAGISKIVVSTDHPLIALHALKAGANIFLRSRVTATNIAPSIWGVAEYINSEPTVSVVVLLQATSPFTQPQSIRKALRYSENYDCVFSVTRSYKLRWSKKNNQLFALNFQIESRPRRQVWSGELLETGAFYLTRRHLIESGSFQNNNCTVVEVSQYESFEVDTFYDLKFANILNSNN